MIDDFYQAALAAMRHHLDAAAATYLLDEGEIVLGSHRLGLSIAFDDFVSQGELTLAPVEIQIHVDGDTGEKFRVGALGVGADSATAMREAIAEWHLLCVVPLLAALGTAVENRRGPARPQKLAGWDLFVGRVGIRGAVPPELRAGGAFYQSLLSRLHQIVAPWDQPNRFELRSIYFMATRSKTECEVQAAVDGMLEAKLAESLQGLPWPVGVDTYLYKQLFVLRAGSEK